MNENTGRGVSPNPLVYEVIMIDKGCYVDRVGLQHQLITEPMPRMQKIKAVNPGEWFKSRHANDGTLWRVSPLSPQALSVLSDLYDTRGIVMVRSVTETGEKFYVNEEGSVDLELYLLSLRSFLRIEKSVRPCWSQADLRKREIGISLPRRVYPMTVVTLDEASSMVDYDTELVRTRFSRASAIVVERASRIVNVL